jgi:pantoate--beta-alanine ligase
MRTTTMNCVIAGRAARRALFSTSSSSATSLDSKWRDALSTKKPGELLVCRSVADMRALRRAMDELTLKRDGRWARVGFVPTMGALHRGHLVLVDEARRRGGSDAQEPSSPPSPSSPSAAPADFVVASIFVNPTQFAPHEDLGKYPRTWDADTAALRTVGADAVFAPTASDMYPPESAPFRTFVNVSGVDTTTPEGSARPGFFRGVATVVTKLLNIVAPTHACFGQKDGIQCIVVRQGARDLNVPVRIDVIPTLRDPDGLAMSSRNVYLTPVQRAAAPAIYAGLVEARAAFEASADGKAWLAEVQARAGSRRAGGAGAPAGVSAEVQAQLAAVAAKGDGAAGGGVAATFATAPKEPLEPALQKAADTFVRVLRERGRGEFGELQYVTFSDAATGSPIARLSESTARNGAVMLSVAVKIGATRLLDNHMFVGTPADLGMPAGMA